MSVEELEDNGHFQSLKERKVTVTVKTRNEQFVKHLTGSLL